MSDQYLTDLAKSLSPYIPGEQPRGTKVIKLNTNENPYGPSEKVLDAIEAAKVCLRLYPDPASDELRQAIADYYTIPKEYVFVGNGSDEVLALTFPAFFTGRSIAYPDITYSFYPVYAKLFGTGTQEIPLKEDFSLDCDAFVELGQEIKGILIPNPNAPTGRALSLGQVERIIEANSQGVVLIDEAYVDFGCQSAVRLIEKYDNLLVVQTLSKSRSLAGLRVGFALGAPGLIEGLVRVKDSFNSYPIDLLAQAGARAAIEDRAYCDAICGRIIKTRENTVKELEGLGFLVIPSSANFVFISHGEKRAEEVFQSLRENGILVRWFNKPRIDNFLRVTIGTDEEMGQSIDALKKFLK